MRDRFPLFAVGALALFVAAGAWLVRGAQRGRFADALSTWSAAPDGARALFTLAQQSGLDVRRHQSDLQLLDPGTHLVLLGVGHHAEAPAPAEAADGGSDAARAPERTSWRRLYSTPLSEDEQTALLAHVAKGHHLLYVPTGADGDPLLDALDVVIVDRGVEGRRRIVPPFPSPWARGVREARAEVLGHVGADEGAPILIDEETEAVVARVVDHGEGQVAIVAAPALARNAALADADNAQLWLSLLRETAGGGALLFDEYHHGFSDERSIAEFATRYGLQFAILQLLLALGLWILASRRFGRPRAPAEEARLGSTDALSAASRLYREGRHHAHAAALVAAGLRRELASHAGVAPRAPLPEVAAALRARGEGTLADGLEAVERMSARASGEHDVESAVRRAVEVRQNLRRRRGMRRAAPEAPRSTA